MLNFCNWISGGESTFCSWQYSISNRNSCRSRGQCWLTNFSCLTTWWNHAHAIDAIMIETLVGCIEEITQVSTATSTSDFPLCAEAQISCGIPVRASWHWIASVAHIG